MEKKELKFSLNRNSGGKKNLGEEDDKSESQFPGKWSVIFPRILEVLSYHRPDCVMLCGIIVLNHEGCLSKSNLTTGVSTLSKGKFRWLMAK